MRRASMVFNSMTLKNCWRLCSMVSMKISTGRLTAPLTHWLGSCWYMIWYMTSSWLVWQLHWLGCLVHDTQSSSYVSIHQLSSDTHVLLLVWESSKCWNITFSFLLFYSCNVATVVLTDYFKLWTFYVSNNLQRCDTRRLSCLTFSHQ